MAVGPNIGLLNQIEKRRQAAEASRALGSGINTVRGMSPAPAVSPGVGAGLGVAGQALGGDTALGGAASGAAAGSSVAPGIGTAVGAGVGLVGGLLSGAAKRRAEARKRGFEREQKGIGMQQQAQQQLSTGQQRAFESLISGFRSALIGTGG